MIICLDNKGFCDNGVIKSSLWFNKFGAFFLHNWDILVKSFGVEKAGVFPEEQNIH